MSQLPRIINQTEAQQVKTAALLPLSREQLLQLRHSLILELEIYDQLIWPEGKPKDLRRKRLANQTDSS